VETAEELARKQRSISVAEFFEKNKHLLGFDSPTRGIITTIKEAVDNALDACEEAGVLPDIFVQVRKVSDEVFRIGVEDNGPGIVPEQIPPVFGKLLYGSRFHQIRQSRGQQGIGISAAILYAQLTTGMPAIIISRTDARKKAHRFELMIKTESNEPDIRSHTPVDWERTHGTRVEIEFKSTLAPKKRLLEYLKYTSIVNPHARITADIDGELSTFERVSAEPVPCPKAIQPHPHGIELGTLKRMLSAHGTMTLEPFLIENFSRVGKQVAREICENARLNGEQKVSTLQPAEQKRLLLAMQSVQIPAPPASACLSPIGEDLIRRSMDKEFSLDFVAARTRPSSVYSGHPFVVEAAIGYGGKLSAEDRALILRFANRVPLLYQPGACAITNAVAGVNWKQYNISQQTLPLGPIIILVHVASTNVPFTSESKDAVASIPEIEREIGLALKDLGRELKLFLSRRDRKRVADDRARAICAVIPEIAAKVGEIVEKPTPDTRGIEGRIMKKVVARRKVENGTTRIEVNNYTPQHLTLKVYDFSPEPAVDARPKPTFSEKSGDEFTRVWNCDLAPGATWYAQYKGHRPGHIDMMGVDEKQKVVMDLDD
jgi:DNA topoisomerase-6 subunit B